MQTVVIKGIQKDFRSNEAYKTLRTNIEFSGAENKTIVLTSSTPEEGKSTVALGLAAALAEGGRKVLFIDADLRKSVLMGRHRVTEAVKGLSHYLSGQASDDDIICKTQEDGLHIVFAGVVPPNPSELLGQEKFAYLIDNAKKVYDYIIIDAPPLGSVIDAAVIAKVCDASILVIGAKMISHKFVRTIKAQLEKTGCPILGVVLNKVDMKRDKYYRRYYGKYYGNYESES